VDSFVDTFLVQEFSKNVDAYRLSSYFYKDREDKIVSGPAWDLDRTYGNTDNSQASLCSGWIFNSSISADMNDNSHSVPFWWPTLVKDKIFNAMVVDRYRSLRKPGKALSDDVIYGAIDGFSSELSSYDAHTREYLKWGYLWPPLDKQIDTDYHTYEVNKLKLWIKLRLEYMDNNIQNLNNNY